MTPPPNRGGRRRRRRGQRQHPDGNQARHQSQQSPPQANASEHVGGSQPDAQRQRQGSGQPADRQSSGARKRTRPKRRPNRHPTIGPMPSEVLKAPFRKARPVRDMERLQLHEVLAGEEDGLQFGCPMLTRTRLALPSTGNVPSPRCSMGWALHSENEVALCLRTPDLLDCWKLDAQREEKLRAHLEEEPAAD